MSAQERRHLNLDARIEELSQDMAASFKQISGYLGKIEDRLDHVEDRLDRLEGRFDKLEATAITKDDLAATETRILGVFRQILTAINLQQPPSQ